MSPWAADPAMPTGLAFARSCVDSLGRIYVVGGIDGGPTQKRANRFNPATDTWTALADMNHIRQEHALVCLSNDHVIAIGGQDGTDSLATVEEYNPTNDTWTDIASLPTPRKLLGAAVTEDDDIYVAGGFNTFLAGYAAYGSELYRMTGGAGSWTTLTSFSEARWDHAFAYDGSDAVNPRLIVAGGVESGTGDEEDSIERYDINTDTWSTLAPLSTGRRTAHVVTDAANGIVYLLGGQANAAYTDLAEAIDVASGVTTLLDPMSTPRVQAAATIDLQGRPIIAGGYSGIGVGYLDSSERYDPVTMAWETLAAMALGQFQATGEYSDLRFYVMGGAALDVNDFDPIDVSNTYVQSIELPSAPPEEPPVDEGGGGQGGSGRSAPTAGFIPITNFGSDDDAFDGYPGDDIFPGDDLFPMA